jgi:hypothetical protein
VVPGQNEQHHSPNPVPSQPDAGIGRDKNRLSSLTSKCR